MNRILGALGALLLLTACDDPPRTPSEVYIGRAAGFAGAFDVYKIDPGHYHAWIYAARRVAPEAPMPAGGTELPPPQEVSRPGIFHVLRIDGGRGAPFIYVDASGGGMQWGCGKSRCGALTSAAP